MYEHLKNFIVFIRTRIQDQLKRERNIREKGGAKYPFGYSIKSTLECPYRTLASIPNMYKILYFF